MIFPRKLYALPQNYGQRLPLFDDITDITARKHVDKINYFIFLEEVVEDDVKMRLIAQVFLSEVKRWFCALTATSIANSQ